MYYLLIEFCSRLLQGVPEVSGGSLATINNPQGGKNYGYDFC
jgi:hypothetical protein